MAVQACPAVNQVEARYFEVPCPFDLRLRCEKKDSNFEIYSVPEGTRIDEELIKKNLNLMPIDSWRNKDRPVIQIECPYAFITDDDSRDDLVAHVYDVTYGSVKTTDNLVIIDDSIVRGTTLQKSILKMMDRLNPKKIVVVSSAPQIRYPDCYGIDMARLEDLIAFRAMLALLKDNNKYHLVEEVYNKCKSQVTLKDSEVTNSVKELYDLFTNDQISNKISKILAEEGIKAEVDIIFQTVENLHRACPKNLGDWYFTGDYPTAGGNRVVNRAFMNFFEGNKERAY